MNQHIGVILFPAHSCYSAVMAKQPAQFPLPMVDTSDLTDADAGEINNLKSAWAAAGHEGLRRALNKLFKEPIIGTRIMAVFYPEMVKEVIRDEMAEHRMTKEEVEALLRKLKSPVRDQ